MIFSRFFASPSGFLLFRTRKDPFIREDFQRILREGQERRPFHASQDEKFSTIKGIFDDSKARFCSMQDGAALLQNAG